MELDWSKKKRKLTTVVLLCVSAILAAATLIKLAGFLVAPASAQGVADKAAALCTLDANDVQKYCAEAKAVADELKKKNLFASPLPRKHPVKEVSGILGSEVLIADNWYKLGGKIGDAKVVAVEPTRVTIEWDGKKKVFEPIAAAIVGGPAKGATKKPVTEKKTAAKGVAVKPVQRKVAVAPAEEDVLAWIGVKLSDKLRSKFLEKWNGLSNEEKAEAKTKWKSMSGEQKKQVVEGMERRM